MRDAALPARAHHPRLDDINWARHRRRRHARQETRAEMRRQVIPKGGMLDQDPLKHIVTSQLAGRHGRRPGAVRPHAPEPAAEPFLARHPRKPVHGVRVVPSLRGRQGRVVLHAHVQHVGHVAHQTASYARDGRHGD